MEISNSNFIPPVPSPSPEPSPDPNPTTYDYEEIDVDEASLSQSVESGAPGGPGVTCAPFDTTSIFPEAGKTQTEPKSLEYLQKQLEIVQEALETPSQPSDVYFDETCPPDPGCPEPDASGTPINDSEFSDAGGASAPDNPPPAPPSIPSTDDLYMPDAGDSETQSILLETTPFVREDGKVSKVVTYNPDGSVKSSRELKYGKDGNVAKIVDRDGDGSITRTTRQSYDEDGNLTGLQIFDSKGGIVETTDGFSHDSYLENYGFFQRMGNVIKGLFAKPQ